MSKFCGNCGTKHDDDAVKCMNCGTPFTNMQQLIQQQSQDQPQFEAQPPQDQHQNSQIQSVLPVYQAIPIKIPANVKKMIVPGAIGAAALILIIVLVSVLTSMTGHNALVNKFEKAYTDYDYEKVADMYSETTLYSYDNDKEAVGSLVAEKMERNLSYFDSRIGHDYKIKFEIVDDYEMADSQFENFKSGLSYFDDNSDDPISGARIIEMNMTAKQNEREATKRVKVIITKEKGKWKIAQFYNY